MSETSWNVEAEKELQRDWYCIASVHFWDAPIAPYVVRCIVKVRRGGTIGSNQDSQRGHGHGQVEADPMVLAFSRFAR